MATIEVQAYGQALRDAPTPVADNNKPLIRCTQSGELYVQPLDETALCDGGELFLFRNATRGTGVIGHAAPTDITVDTKPLVLVRNTHATKRIYMKSIRLQWTAAGTNATNQSFATEIDKGSSRYTSGGTAAVNVNPNMDLATSPSVAAYFGAITAAAASADRRNLMSGLLTSAIPVIGDTLVIEFGNAAKQMYSGVVAGTAIHNHYIPHVPVVLGENDNFLLHLAGASQSVAAAFEYEIVFVQR